MTAEHVASFWPYVVAVIVVAVVGVSWARERARRRGHLLFAINARVVTHAIQVAELRQGLARAVYEKAQAQCELDAARAVNEQLSDLALKRHDLLRAAGLELGLNIRDHALRDPLPSRPWCSVRPSRPANIRPTYSSSGSRIGCWIATATIATATLRPPR